MNVKLTIGERLKDLRTEKELTLEALAEATGLSKSALNSYENDDYKDISHTAIITLATFYDVSADYLLGLTQDLHPEKYPVEALNLSDDVLALLSSGRLNNRLLGELILHPDFEKLLTDIEIYVDGIVRERIMQLNSLVAKTRADILNAHPDANDIYIKTLEAAEILDDKYFYNLIQSDLEPILQSTRDAHLKDSTSMGNYTSNVTEADIATIENTTSSISATKEDKTILLALGKLGVPIGSINAEDYEAMKRLLSKSKLLSSHSPKRGKQKKKQ